MNCVYFSVVGAVVLLAGVGDARAATVYTADTNIAHFTAGITTYATFSNFSHGDVASPFTPTSSELATHGDRVYAGGPITGLSRSNNWILATFSDAQSQIRVFPSIDHFGSAFDGYRTRSSGVMTAQRGPRCSTRSR